METEDNDGSGSGSGSGEDSQHDDPGTGATKQSQKSQKERSQVWTHFTKDKNFKENKKAICNHCGIKYTCSGSSTSNLSKHLKKHPIQTGKTQQMGQSIIEMFGSTSKVNYKVSFYFIFFF